MSAGATSLGVYGGLTEGQRVFYEFEVVHPA